MFLMNKDQDDPDVVASWPAMAGYLAFAGLLLIIAAPFVLLALPFSRPTRGEDDRRLGAVGESRRG